jgi:hypothetical protein
VLLRCGDDAARVLTYDAVLSVGSVNSSAVVICLKAVAQCVHAQQQHHLQQLHCVQLYVHMRRLSMRLGTA